MARRSLLVASSLLAALASNLAARDLPPRLMGRLRPGLEDRSEGQAGMERSLGAQRLRALRAMRGMRILEFPAGHDLKSAREALLKSGDYLYVEEDRLVHALTTLPNDPRLQDGSQWGLRNIGANSGVPGFDIGAPAGWSVRSTAPTVTVAVIDTGARLNHPDLVANLWVNTREIAGNNRDDDGNGYIDDVHGIDSRIRTGTTGNGNPADTDGHGTHVAGTIGAVGGNGIGVTGVAWSVRVMPLRFMAESSDGTATGNLFDAIECIDYAIAQGAKVINCSYGSSSFSQSELDAIQRAKAAGIIVVAAAGNASNRLDDAPLYPAAYLSENLVTVGASTRLGDAAAFSNTSPGLVDLSAPGSEILSLGHLAGNEYVTLSGTSMAAPHVAGALALLAAQYPSEHYRSLVHRLIGGARRLPAFTGRSLSGAHLDLAGMFTATGVPPNDRLTNAYALRGSSFKVKTSTRFATTEPSDPRPGGVYLPNTVWFRWMAPSSGALRISSAGSEVRTSLALYSGGLSLISSNVASTASGGALIQGVQVVEGTEYILLAGSVAADGGGLLALDLKLSGANDRFAAARTIPGMSARIEDDNADASVEPGEPALMPGTTATRTLWYAWTATTTESFSASTHAPSDTQLAVFTGNSLSSLNRIAFSQRANAARAGSTVRFQANAGTTYRIAVGSPSGTTPGAFELTLARARWVHAAGGSITSSPALAANGTVYVTSLDGTLSAVDASGNLLWSRVGETETLASTGYDLATPLVRADGSVVVAGRNGLVRAYSADGTTLWSRVLDAGVVGSPSMGPDGTHYVRTNTAAAGSSLNRLHALTPGGTSRWSAFTGDDSYGSPTVSHDGTTVLVATTNGTLLAFNTTTGALRWSHSLTGTGEATASASYTTPALSADGTAHVGTMSGHLISVNALGQRVRSISLGSSITSSPAIGHDGTLYVGAYDDRLHAIGPDGTLLWRYETRDDIRASSPAIGSDGTLYIGSHDGGLHVVSKDGVLIERLETGDWLRSSPVLRGGTVYAGSSDGRLYAFPAASPGPARTAWPMFKRDEARTGRGAPQPPLPGLQVEHLGDWVLTPDFGYTYHPHASKWIWHEHHAWLFPAQGPTGGGRWFFDRELGWVWTSGAAYPALFRSNPSGWLHYQAPTQSPRRFYDHRLGRWTP